MLVYYQTAEAQFPQLMYAEDPKYPNEVAVFASFVPTFEAPEPQEKMQVVQDEEPVFTEMSNGKDFLFVFIVDRSGSMGKENRIFLTVEALKLFLRSLP